MHRHLLEQLGTRIEDVLLDKLPLLSQGQLADLASSVHPPPAGGISSNRGWRKAMARHALASIRDALATGRLRRVTVTGESVRHWERWDHVLSCSWSPGQPPVKPKQVAYSFNLDVPHIPALTTPEKPDQLNLYFMPSSVNRPAEIGTGFTEALRTANDDRPRQHPATHLEECLVIASLYLKLLRTDSSVASWTFSTDDLFGPDGDTFPDAFIRRGGKRVAVRARLFYSGNGFIAFRERMHALEQAYEFWDVTPAL